MDIPERYGITVFCDDIREEVGGKSSYIGIYKGVMYVQADFPLTLPKLGMGVILNQKLNAFASNIKLRIILPDNETMELAAPSMDAQRSQLEPDAELHQLYLKVIVSPLILKGEGSIKVRAICDGEEVRLGALRIIHRPAKPVASATSQA